MTQQSTRKGQRRPDSDFKDGDLKVNMRVTSQFDTQSTQKGQRQLERDFKDGNLEEADQSDTTINLEGVRLT